MSGKTSNRISKCVHGSWIGKESVYVPSDLLLWLGVGDEESWISALAELLACPKEELPVLGGDAGLLELGRAHSEDVGPLVADRSRQRRVRRQVPTSARDRRQELFRICNVACRCQLGVGPVSKLQRTTFRDDDASLPFGLGIDLTGAATAAVVAKVLELDALTDAITVVGSRAIIVAVSLRRWEVVEMVWISK